MYFGEIGMVDFLNKEIAKEKKAIEELVSGLTNDDGSLKSVAEVAHALELSATAIVASAKMREFVIVRDQWLSKANNDGMTDFEIAEISRNYIQRALINNAKSVSNKGTMLTKNIAADGTLEALAILMDAIDFIIVSNKEGDE